MRKKAAFGPLFLDFGGIRAIIYEIRIIRKTI